MPDVIQRAFILLQRAEGYFAAAAYREMHRPPYQRGKACAELDEVRELLAEIQQDLKK